jgi:hypothetical protein
LKQYQESILWMYTKLDVLGISHVMRNVLESRSQWFKGTSTMKTRSFTEGEYDDGDTVKSNW